MQSSLVSRDVALHLRHNLHQLHKSVLFFCFSVKFICLFTLKELPRGYNFSRAETEEEAYLFIFISWKSSFIFCVCVCVRVCERSVSVCFLSLSRGKLADRGSLLIGGVLGRDESGSYRQISAH